MGRSGAHTAARAARAPVRRSACADVSTRLAPPRERIEQQLLAMLSDERSGRLPWTDGACWTLAVALKERFGRRARLRTLIGLHGAEHVVVQLGSLFLDGDGVSTRRELHERWRSEYGVEGARLVPFSWSKERAVLRPPDFTIVDELAALAREYLPDELVAEACR